MDKNELLLIDCIKCKYEYCVYIYIIQIVDIYLFFIKTEKFNLFVLLFRFRVFLVVFSFTFLKQRFSGIYIRKSFSSFYVFIFSKLLTIKLVLFYGWRESILMWFQNMCIQEFLEETLHYFLIAFCVKRIFFTALSPENRRLEMLILIENGVNFKDFQFFGSKQFSNI